MGIAQNKRLLKQSKALQEQAETAYQETHEKQRLFSEVMYAAATWDRLRRVIVKAEHTVKGSNPRFVVTSLPGDPASLYDDLYCARGNMENRIKEQLSLFSDRTSCHAWWANQFRLLLSSAAYILVESLRRMGLKDTVLKHAQAKTIQLKLLKVGAVIVRNTRRVKFLLSSAYPYQALFFSVAEKLCPG